MTERTYPISNRFYDFFIVIFLAVFMSGLVWTVFTAKSFAPIADFKCFYMAGKIIAEGKGHDLFEVETQKAELLKVIPGHLKYYFNPPVFALPFALLSYFSLMPAYWIWTVLSLVALFIGLFLIISLSGLKGRAQWLFGTAALAFEPTYHNLHWGNVSTFVLLLLALFFRDLLAGKDQRAGVWLALLMIKPELFLIPALVVSIKQKWLFLKGYLGMGLVLLILSLAIVGLDGFGDYIKINLDAARSYTEVQTELHLSNMISFRAFFVRFLYGTAVAEIFSFIYTALSLLLLWMVWRGDWKTNSIRFGRQWSLTLLVSLLVAPHVYLQSLILIFPAAALFLRGSNYLNGFRFYYFFPLGALSAIALSWLPEIQTTMGLTILQIALFTATLFLTWTLLSRGQEVPGK